jgi:H+/Cl- antiporter ClcA
VNERPSYRRTFFRLLGFLKPYKWSLIVSIVLAIGSLAAAVVMAFLTGDGLQEAASGGSREAIWWIALGILAAGLVRALLMMGRRRSPAARRWQSSSTCATASTRSSSGSRSGSTTGTRRAS